LDDSSVVLPSHAYGSRWSARAAQPTRMIARLPNWLRLTSCAIAV